MSEPILQRTANARIPTTAGLFQLYHFANNRDGKEHVALVMGDVAGQHGVLTRVHSECMTGDVFGSRRCDCGEQLHDAMRAIAAEGRGVIVYLRQEGRGIGLAEKLRAYNLQDQGYDTVEANLLLGHQADEREYWAAVGILADLGIISIRLLTNNPAKIEHLREQGVNVAERVPLLPSIHADNAVYLETKVRRMRHLLQMPATPPATVAGMSLSPELSQRVAELQQRAITCASERGLPFVTLTYAQSLDGSIASATRQPLAFSGPQAMTLTHALRATHDAILVGIGTVLADDPQLTVRLVAGPHPQPVVLDSHLRFPPHARLLQHPRGVWLAATRHDRAEPLPASAEVLAVDADQERVDLTDLLRRLAARGIRSVMVEGGATVISSFLRQRLADYVVVTMSPRYVGGLTGLAGAPAHGNGALPRLHEVGYTPAGDDLIVWGEPVWEGRA
jgi:3,4-dihydroxy 2-butanone 4-phosphate synthase/GTP cyclohydrolase II